MRKKQVSKGHYDESHYDTEPRFVGYYTQKELIYSIQNATERKDKFRLLEIGPGSGLLTDYLRKADVDVTTLDIAPDLKPDIVGDITNIDEYVSDKYSAVCCFEVLEHIPYEDLDKIIEGFENISTKFVVVSIPRVRLYASLWIKFSRIKRLALYMSLPFPKKHVFDGQHYWELGAKGYPEKDLLKKFTTRFHLRKRLVNPLDPYHIYYIWEK